VSSAAFERALRQLDEFEGGTADSAIDRGGFTHRGITQRLYDRWRASHGQPKQAVVFVTDAEREALCFEYFWSPCRCPELPAELAIAVFDMAFNSGQEDAIRALQTAVGARVDGKLGPETIAAAHRADETCRAAPPHGARRPHPGSDRRRPAAAGQPRRLDQQVIETGMETSLVRFMRHVARDPAADGCWIWTGATSGSSYGAAKMGGKQWQAHRLSYTLHRGEIPAGLLVCHRCDVRTCVNPEHLFLGTHRDNMIDKVRKGRHVVSRGEANGAAKLDAERVAKIRDAAGPQRQIAITFGVAQTLVSQIKRGVVWRRAA
jgi:hypothetical protein